MSIYTSLTISRQKAMEVVLKKLATASNDELRNIASLVLEEGQRYNLYMVTDDPQPDDDKV